MNRLGRDAVAVLDHLDIARAHFCGLSMGGMVGMWLLTHAPERIGRAVLANTSAHMGPPSLWNDRIALARAGGMEETVEPTVQRWFPAAFHASAPDTIERMRAMIRRISPTWSSPRRSPARCWTSSPTECRAPWAKRIV